MFRPDQSRLKLSLEDVDVGGPDQKLVAGFVSRHPREFRLHLPDHVRAAVDPVRLEQVMANLIDNAVRYSPDGGPIDISVELENDDWSYFRCAIGGSVSRRSTAPTSSIASTRRTG